jgi:hypothetical protein
VISLVDDSLPFVLEEMLDCNTIKGNDGLKELGSRFNICLFAPFAFVDRFETPSHALTPRIFFDELDPPTDVYFILFLLKFFLVVVYGCGTILDVSSSIEKCFRKKNLAHYLAAVFHYFFDVAEESGVTMKATALVLGIEIC